MTLRKKFLIAIFYTILILFTCFPGNSVSLLFAQEILFSDDFSDGNFDGWVVGMGSWDASTYALKATSFYNQHAWIGYSCGNADWKNYSLEFDWSYGNGTTSDGHIWFRVEDENPPIEGGHQPDNGYCLQIMDRGEPSYHGYTLYKRVNDQEISLIEQTDIPDGLGLKEVLIQVYEINESTKISIKLNVSTLIEFIDTDISRPQYGGICIDAYHAVTEQTWDNFRVKYTVPVELSKFDAFLEKNEVILNWTTQTETENLGFHVYRSTTETGKYIKISRELIKGVGNSDQAHTYSYTDRDVEAGNTYNYKLADMDFNGNMTFHGPISVTVNAQLTEYSLAQNHPNPFNSSTEINFSLKEKGTVTLKIYNLQGQLMRTIINEKKSAGNYCINWDGTDKTGNKVASNVYLYTLQINDFKQTKKPIFLK